MVGLKSVAEGDGVLCVCVHVCMCLFVCGCGWDAGTAE